MPFPAVPPDPIRLYTFDAACAAIEAGLSLIPISGDGSKSPAWRLLPYDWDAARQSMKHQWAIYSTRQPTLDEITYWFLMPRPGPPCGFGIVGGPVSGGLEIIDFDQAELFDAWASSIRLLRPGLLEILTIVRSPRPGIHVYLRSQLPGPNRKLAQRMELDEQTGRSRPKTLIEVKAQGGYVLAPGSPGCCHPSGRCYEFVTANGFDSIPTVSIDDRNLMLIEAMRFNEVTTSQQIIPVQPVRPPATNRPGDLFAQTTSWAEILVPHGWVCTSGNRQGVAKWRRPEKSSGQSATTNHANTDLLRVFSENAAPFETGRSYTKFSAFALLNHDGDFTAAAAALVVQGFTCRNIGPAVTHRNRHRSRQRHREHF